MSTVLLMHIIPSDKGLTTEYLRTYSVALLFWHTGTAVHLAVCFLRSMARQC